MAEKKIKTNAMRILDTMKIGYEVITYTVDESDLSGEHIAAEIGEDPDDVYKTLVLHGDRTGFIVACMPVAAELDLKALARESGNKSVEMLHVRDLLSVTGYIRGGCSPIGMKKKFPTYIDNSILTRSITAFSGGMRGLQVKLTPADMIRAASAKTAKITF